MINSNTGHIQCTKHILDEYKETSNISINVFLYTKILKLTDDYHIDSMLYLSRICQELWIYMIEHAHYIKLINMLPVLIHDVDIMCLTLLSTNEHTNFIDILDNQMYYLDEDDINKLYKHFICADYSMNYKHLNTHVYFMNKIDVSQHLDFVVARYIQLCNEISFDIFDIFELSRNRFVLSFEQLYRLNQSGIYNCNDDTMNINTTNTLTIINDIENNNIIPKSYIFNNVSKYDPCIKNHVSKLEVVNCLLSYGTQLSYENIVHQVNKLHKDNSLNFHVLAYAVYNCSYFDDYVQSDDIYNAYINHDMVYILSHPHVVDYKCVLCASKYYAGDTKYFELLYTYIHKYTPTNEMDNVYKLPKYLYHRFENIKSKDVNELVDINTSLSMFCCVEPDIQIKLRDIYMLAINNKKIKKCIVSRNDENVSNMNNMNVFIICDKNICMYIGTEYLNMFINLRNVIDYLICYG